MQSDAEARQRELEQERLQRRDAKAARVAQLQRELVSAKQQAHRLALGGAATPAGMWGRNMRPWVDSYAC